MKATNKIYSYTDFKSINAMILYEEAMSTVDERYDIMHTDPGISARYKGNFIGLMIKLGIPPNKQILVMHMNDITNPYDFDGRSLELKIPKDTDSPYR